MTCFHDVRVGGGVPTRRVIVVDGWLTTLDSNRVTRLVRDSTLPSATTRGSRLLGLLPRREGAGGVALGGAVDGHGPRRGKDGRDVHLSLGREDAHLLDEGGGGRLGRSGNEGLV